MLTKNEGKGYRRKVVLYCSWYDYFLLDICRKVSMPYCIRHYMEGRCVYVC